MSDLLTIDEAAARLRKRPRWLRDWLRANPPREGEPSFYLQAGRDKLFSLGDLARIEARINVPRSVKDKRGHIYFVESHGFIKIGWAANAKARLAGLQVASPVPIKLLGVMFGTMQDEKALQAKFSEHCERGEWFRPSPRLRRGIKALTNHALLRECQ